jgi:hypothetical protein
MIFRRSTTSSTQRPSAHGLAAARQLAFLGLTIGCFVSMLASGRLSARLVVDGALSFAFIPILEVLALLLVLRLCRPRVEVPFAVDLTLFLMGNTPWLLWLALAGAMMSVVPPRAIGLGLTRAVEASTIVPIVWSFLIDLRFFRETAGRSPSSAVRAALLHRAIGWPLAFAYFLGIAIWTLVQPTFAGWLGR